MTDKITKAGSRVADTYDFVLSSETPDRVGDIIKMDGLSTKEFLRNPVALYMHRHNDPIGIWSNLKKANGVLMGTLRMAAQGTSPLIDFARSMVEQGMLKAVSVSIIPKRAEPNNDRGRTVFESELIEVSLVSVPMNPRALMIAKSLGLSDEDAKSFLSPVDEGLILTVNRDPSQIINRAKSAILAAKRTVRS